MLMIKIQVHAQTTLANEMVSICLSYRMVLMDRANLTEPQRQLPCGGMRNRILLIVLLGLLLCGVAPGSIIFRPGEKAKVLAPGEEEINGNAQELFRIAEEAERDGNLGRAIKACQAIWRKYPQDMLAERGLP